MPSGSKKISSVDRPQKKKHAKLRQKKTVVSFFCGCGGLDLGFLGGFSYMGTRIPELPFEFLAAYDYDDRCIETYVQNISCHRAEVQDLSKYKLEKTPSAEILIGGFPCQDFATCGPRQGLNSTRGRLYRKLTQYMDIHRPLVVIGENVPGLANMSQGDALDIILGDMALIGYKVKVWTLFAPDYGIPQNRTRLFIIAVRDDLKGFPIKPRKSYGKENYRTTSWAIEDLMEIDNQSVPNQLQYFKASKAKKGNGQGDETNLADFPSYTIRANAKSRVQFHYALNRRLTVRECARLQTFPDTFCFPHSATTNIMQIGNAVPPILGNRVARSIDRYLEDIKCH